jgi:hypothetical protein
MTEEKKEEYSESNVPSTWYNTCVLSYSGGRHWEDLGLRPSSKEKN